MAINKKEATASKGATTKTSKAPTGAKKSNQGALAAGGKELYRSMKVEEQDLLGSRSKDVAFINLIGNPYNMVPRGTNGKGSESVGLLLKNVSDEPFDVMKFTQKTKSVMDADFAHPTTVTVAPGEEFLLTWAEAGAFSVRDEFNGYLLGSEDEGKRLRYTPNSTKGGGIPTTKFILVGDKKKGSIADYTLDIATPEEMKERKVSPRFEADFRAFAIQQRANSGVAMKSKGRNVNAAAIGANKLFEALINSATEETAPEVAE